MKIINAVWELVPVLDHFLNGEIIFETFSNFRLSV